MEAFKELVNVLGSILYSNSLMQPHTMLRLWRKSPRTLISARILESWNDQEEHLRPEGPQKMLPSNALRHLSDRDTWSEYGPWSHWNRGPIPASATYPAVTLGQGSIFLEPRFLICQIEDNESSFMKMFWSHSESKCWVPTCARSPLKCLVHEWTKLMKPLSWSLNFGINWEKIMMDGWIDR